MAAGWLTSELAPHLLALTVADTVRELARGRRDRPALALAAGSLARRWRRVVAQSARAQGYVDGALVEALGPDYRDRLRRQPHRPRPVHAAEPAGDAVPGARRRGRDHQGPALRHRARQARAARRLPAARRRPHGRAGAAARARRRLVDRRQGAPGHPADAAHGGPRLGLRHDQLPAQPARPVPGAPRRREAGDRVDPRARSPTYGADPSFLAVTGGSAGGHLAALAALTPNDPEYQPGFEDADTSVQAAAPHYGVYDFAGATGAVAAQLMRDRFLGAEGDVQGPGERPRGVRAGLAAAAGERRRPAVLRGARPQRLPRRRRPGPDLRRPRSGRCRSSRSPTPSCPAPSTRSTSSRPSGRPPWSAASTASCASATTRGSTTGPGMTGLPADLRAKALAAKGFMPEDEGDLLYDVAVRALTARPRARGRHLLRQVGDLPRRRRPGRGQHRLHRRPPPRLGGEPGRLGVPRRRRWPTPSSAASTRSRCSGTRSRTPASRTRWSRSSAGRRRSPPCGALPWPCCSSTAGTPTSTPATTTPAGAAGSRAAARWWCTTCSPTPRTVARRRTGSTCGRWRAASPRSAALGSMRVLTRVGGDAGDPVR